MNPKLNCDIFIEAAENVDSRLDWYSCCAICRVASLDYRRPPEREFYEKIFGLSCYEGDDNYTFDSMDDGQSTRNQIQEIRVLALCFAAEIARLKNNKK
jgi:hypothetical protein